MRFLWPEGLWLLAAVPAAVAAYLYLVRRRKRAVLRYPSLALLRAARPAAAWRRHVPPALVAVGTLAALLAAARPSAVITLPMQQRTLILAIDVSLSMRVTDVQPSRIVAAQEAAKAFVRALPRDVRVGIVSFAGTAALVQRPTNEVEELVAAIDRLQLDRHTAIGSGLVVSLATLFPDHGIELEPMVLGRRQERRREAPPKPGRPAWKPVEPGSNPSKAIILLTDGRRTTGPDPDDIARMAAERGVKVFTVGFGTPQGASLGTEGYYSIFMAFDEETLKRIAEITRAEYFYAASAADLTAIYENLGSRLVLQKEETEISFLFAAAAAALFVAAAALSLRWFPRLA